MCNETNINSGDYFSVKKWKYHNDQSYVGQIFQALSIEKTLIHSKRIRGNYGLNELVLLNTDQVDIYKVSDAFAKRAINKCCCCCC